LGTYLAKWSRNNPQRGVVYEQEGRRDEAPNVDLGRYQREPRSRPLDEAVDPTNLVAPKGKAAMTTPEVRADASMVNDERMIVWLCEKGHVDDHHVFWNEPSCSRCGGTCERLSVAALANRVSSVRELVEAARELLAVIAFDDENPCGFLYSETERIKLQNALARFHQPEQPEGGDAVELLGPTTPEPKAVANQGSALTGSAPEPEQPCQEKEEG
jgi:hypothetical protein